MLPSSISFSTSATNITRGPTRPFRHLTVNCNAEIQASYTLIKESLNQRRDYLVMVMYCKTHVQRRNFHSLNKDKASSANELSFVEPMLNIQHHPPCYTKYIIIVGKGEDWNFLHIQRGDQKNWQLVITDRGPPSW